MPLNAQDVGSRIVLRRTAGERDGRQLFTDVLGELVSWDDVVVVRRADGVEVSVPRHEVTAAKRVPARPRRRVDDLELERIAALGWRGLRTARLGDWLLRDGGGWTGRANSVLPLGDPGTDLDAALAHIRTWYADAGLPALIQVPLPARADLKAELLARGWEEAWGGLVLAASATRVLGELPARDDLPPVEFADAPTPEWLGTYHYRGGALPAVAVEVLRGGDQPVFASVVEHGEMVAIARGVLDEGWIGMTAVEVATPARRRGLATHLLRGLLEHGVARGGHSAYLQADLTNAAAHRLYQGVGFTLHHEYRYLRAPALTAGRCGPDAGARRS